MASCINNLGFCGKFVQDGTVAIIFTNLFHEFEGLTTGGQDILFDSQIYATPIICLRVGFGRIIVSVPVLYRNASRIIVIFKIHHAEEASLEVQRELVQAGFSVKGWKAWD